MTDSSDAVAVAEPVNEPEFDCKQCGVRSHVPTKTGPLGFVIQTCPNCGKRSWHPLIGWLRTFYWVLLVLTVVALAILLGGGYLYFPGGLAVVITIVLFVDARLRKSTVSAGVLSALTTFTVLMTILGTVLVVGFSNDYTTSVLERPQSTVPEVSGVNLTRGDQICGPGQDYQICLNMHIAVYNAACVQAPESLVPLVGSANDQCAALSAFIDGARNTLDGCGYGCETRAGDSGLWGMGYLRPLVSTSQVPALAIIVERECFFSFGEIQIGYCRD